MVRDSTSESSATSTASTSSSNESNESTKTTVPAMKNKDNRRESWNSLDTNDKMKMMFSKLEEVDNETDLMKWLKTDPSTGYSVITALIDFHAGSYEHIEQLQADLLTSGQETREAGQEIEELKEAKKDLQRILREREDKFDELRGQSESSPLPTTATTKKLPDISIWTGGTPEEFQAWLTDLRLKLTVNADHFPTDQHKVAYLFNRLGGDARTYIQAFMDEDMEGSYRELLDRLKKRYADPQREATARNKYSMLKQMNKDLPTFLGEFYNLAAAARIPEEWQINDLREKLNDRLNYRIVGMNFNSLPEMVHTLEQVDSHLKLRDQEKAARTSTRKTLTSRPAASANDNQEQSTTDNEVKTKSEPTERRGPPKCYACQEMGHIARNCPKGKVIPSSKS